MQQLLSKSRIKSALSFFLTLVFILTCLVPSAYAIPILPSEASQGEVLPDISKQVQPKNVFPKPGKKRVELENRRTANSCQYLNPDGTFTLEVSPGPINFKNNQGNWEPSRQPADNLIGLRI